MRIAFVIYLLNFSMQLFAQPCDCASQLSFVSNYFEENNPAFQKIKHNPQGYAEYKVALSTLTKATKADADTNRCIIYLNQYVGLLKDHHSDIGFNLTRKDLGSPDLVTSFKASKDYQQFKKIPVDTASLIPYLQSKNISDIEGIYSNGANLVFGIVKDDKTAGKYLGLILKENKLMDAGHLLMQLEAKPGNQYDVWYNVGLLGFTPLTILKRIKIENGQIPNFGFAKIQSGNKDEKPFEFKALNNNVNYLRLQSFDKQLINELDSLYTASDAVIKSKPYLIVDLRNNGGGSERGYLNLLPYAYTKPLQIDSVLIWVSPENIRRYEEADAAQNATLIERMKKAKPFSFIPQVEDAINTWEMDSSTVYPKKIILLFNQGTASAAEGMIQYFMQSDKVITVGENSGGYLGYGNVMTAKTPCGHFTIQSTSTMYNQKAKFEFVGIAPMHTLPATQDWIAYALNLLEQSN